jgi:hypothetical protein
MPKLYAAIAIDLFVGLVWLVVSVRFWPFR